MATWQRCVSVHVPATMRYCHVKTNAAEAFIHHVKRLKKLPLSKLEEDRPRSKHVVSVPSHLQLSKERVEYRLFDKHLRSRVSATSRCIRKVLTSLVTLSLSNPLHVCHTFSCACRGRIIWRLLY
jgi:hypothetical protein